MKYRSKAPFRIGLAGGGSDVSPFSDKFGGATLNASINLYAYTTGNPFLRPVFEHNFELSYTFQGNL